MQLSVGKNKTTFRPLTVETISELESLIVKTDYSCGVFKDNYRNNKNFISTDLVALDFDGGLDIVDASKLFAEYKHIIAPTKSHQVLKDGVKQDRFRVILFLEETVYSEKDYRRVVEGLLKKFPQADKKCKDPARMFYKSSQIYQSNENGRKVSANDFPTSGEKSVTHSPPLDAPNTLELDFSKKPKGWSNCKWALANGMFGPGQSNEFMLVLASTYKALNYTKEQAYHMCLNALQQRKARNGRDYDKVELWEKQIGHVYSEEYKGAVYNCSKEGTDLHEYCQSLGPNACDKEAGSFCFESPEELFNNDEKIDWLVDGLLSKGGISLIAAPPKAGKSTLIRQLALNVSRGQKFLERQCDQGPVYYLALEEQKGLLKEQLTMLGLSKEDDFKLHVGPVYGKDKIEKLGMVLLEARPALLVVDTMVKFLGIEDLNNYNEVYSAIGGLADIARQSNTHILMVHHTNKSDRLGPGSIMGSVGIHGAIDNALIMTKSGKSRFLTTSQRGGIPFDRRALVFMPETQSYYLGEETPDEF